MKIRIKYTLGYKNKNLLKKIKKNKEFYEKADKIFGDEKKPYKWSFRNAKIKINNKKNIKNEIEYQRTLSKPQYIKLNRIKTDNEIMGPPKPPQEKIVANLNNLPIGPNQDINYYEEKSRKGTIKFTYFLVLLIVLIGIGVAIGALNLDKKQDEITEEWYYTESPIDKIKNALTIISNSGQDLKKYVSSDWQENLKIKGTTNAVLNLIPGISPVISIWNYLIDSKVIKIGTFIIGGAWELIEIIIKVTWSIIS